MALNPIFTIYLRDSEQSTLSLSQALVSSSIKCQKQHTPFSLSCCENQIFDLEYLDYLAHCLAHHKHSILHGVHYLCELCKLHEIFKIFHGSFCVFELYLQSVPSVDLKYLS